MARGAGGINMPPADGASRAAMTIREREAEALSRVLTLARESLDMLGHIISVVDETLQRAESWVSPTQNPHQPPGASGLVLDRDGDLDNLSAAPSPTPVDDKERLAY
jgi:hypothetical protein